LDWFLKFWPLIQLVITMGLVWLCWSLRQLAVQEVTRLIAAAVAKLEGADTAAAGKIDAIDTRVTVVEEAVKEIRHDIADLPTKADIARVEGKIDTAVATGTQTAAGVGRLEGFFLAKGVENA
jgi:hypothetical protein